MKYSLDESMHEFEKRIEILQKKRQKRLSRVLMSGVGMMSVVLIVALSIVIGPTTPGQGERLYGSFLLSQDAAGYVIIALIAFILGILLTVTVLYKNGRLKPRKHE